MILFSVACEHINLILAQNIFAKFNKVKGTRFLSWNDIWNALSVFYGIGVQE